MHLYMQDLYEGDGPLDGTMFCIIVLLSWVFAASFRLNHSTRLSNESAIASLPRPPGVPTSLSIGDLEEYD